MKLIAYIVSAHNSQVPRPSFLVGVSNLATLLLEDLKERNGWDASRDMESELELIDFGERALQEDPPPRVDWSDTLAVRPVKQQGQCGCCWAVATVAAIEAAVFIDTGYSDDLSWQQLISCDTSNGGCNGGSVTGALQYTEGEGNSLGGVTTYLQYPFTDVGGTSTDTCEVSSKELAVTVSSLGLAVSSSSPADANERVELIKKVLSRSPFAVVMNANCRLFQIYSSGIITDDEDCACNSVGCIDHAVLMVGYDDTTSPPSFKFKNSWGSDWGEEGYFRVAQTVDQDTMQYGLFGLLYQGSGAGEALNTTVAAPASSTPAATGIQAGTVVAFISGIVLALTSL